MSDKEIREQIEGMRKFSKEITASKEKAIEFLASTGMYTKKGNLKKMFQH